MTQTHSFFRPNDSLVCSRPIGEKIPHGREQAEWIIMLTVLAPKVDIVH